MAMFTIGLQNVNAQDAPIKIVTNHPDFKIKVKRCAASGRTVVLDLILKNEGDNDVEGLRAHSGVWGAEIYDDQGNIYKGTDITIKAANSRNYDTYCADFNIPSEVPITLSLQIKNVSISAESFSRVNIPITCPAWDLKIDQPIRISNIPITRD